MNLFLNRRQALLAGVGAVAAASGMAGASAPTLAAAEDAAAAILEFTGGAEPTMGRVVLDVPEIAENGNTVPMDVTVESPMTADDYVAEVLVVADGNPRPGVATFHFSPLSGRAQANTRIRLAGTQNVIAVAKMSDGSVFMDRKEVKVTIGGCGG
ncbi:thiosulfate oxidation carrier protein SoxY [Salinarimonas sp. NSM]|uniref:thiosulfate oxidation carrier protein SoxY n=1 Tax=Salinarimonas sp. NSM TaxID=3458003 RepID=UPI0040375797